MNNLGGLYFEYCRCPELMTEIEVLKRALELAIVHIAEKGCFYCPCDLVASMMTENAQMKLEIMF